MLQHYNYPMGYVSIWVREVDAATSREKQEGGIIWGEIAPARFRPRNRERSAAGECDGYSGEWPGSRVPA